MYMVHVASNTGGSDEIYPIWRSSALRESYPLCAYIYVVTLMFTYSSGTCYTVHITVNVFRSRPHRGMAVTSDIRTCGLLWQLCPAHTDQAAPCPRILTSTCTQRCLSLVYHVLHVRTTPLSSSWLAAGLHQVLLRLPVHSLYLYSIFRVYVVRNTTDASVGSRRIQGKGIVGRC